MRSLRSRVLITATLVLLFFLGCVGVLLDRAFRDSALNGVEDRLRGHVFMLIGAADFDVVDADGMIGALPDPALSTPGSGHYARILTEHGTGVWASRSLLALELPVPEPIATGEWRLQRVDSGPGEGLFALTYGIAWEGAGEQAPRRFVIQAFESADLFSDTVSRFRRSLWTWFTGLSVALLLGQMLTLSRGLRPLDRVGEEVRAIEQGRQEQILGAYPSELTTLTSNLNRLLKHNRDSLTRYRNSLGDLAHSIKTPLAVLRNELAARSHGAVPDAAQEQIERIDRTVQYHLKRSASAGRALLAPPLRLGPLVQRIAASLRKVHAARELEIVCEIHGDPVMAADEGDMMEIIGNLADNACKWARRRVVIAVGQPAGESAREADLHITVSDDGPGIDSAQIERIKQRGARLDESVEGHGIGLAIVREMVEGAYSGRLVLESDAGGTRARAELPVA